MGVEEGDPPTNFGQKFGFVANKEVNTIICVLCSRGVPVDIVQSHCMKHHLGRVTISKLEQAKTISAQSNSGFMASTSNKYTQPPGQKPVDGLQTVVS